MRATNRQTRTTRLRTHEGDRVRPSLNECRFGSRARNGYRCLEICLEEEEEGERTKPRRYLCRPISSSCVETRTLLMFLSLHFLTEPPQTIGEIYRCVFMVRVSFAWWDVWRIRYNVNTYKERIRMYVYVNCSSVVTRINIFFLLQ